jgi:fermentation-respiration switch protein FrsA (DUF1100 family)
MTAALVVVGVCGLLVPVLNRLAHHGGEAVILLMPPALGVFLWWGWPRLRQVRLRTLLAYPLIMTPLLTAAVAFLSHMAGGRLLWLEVFWALYFFAAWRLAWAVWRRTIGRIGEPLRRWSRRTRRAARGWHRVTPARRRAWAGLGATIPVFRVGLVVTVFAPLLFGSLIHRIKIGIASDLGYYEDWPLEDVTFKTSDGLTLSGWFLSEPDSDTTVIICHGAGASRGNFIDNLSVFRGNGYSSLIFDFRGHGDSDGHTCTFGLYEEADVRAAVDWLKHNRPEQARHVFGIGSSMGAMSLVRAAARDPRIEAIVLDSAFTSAPDMAAAHLGRLPIVGRPMGWLALAGLSVQAGRSFWDLDARPAVADVAPRPIFLIHAVDDIVIPHEQMERLYTYCPPDTPCWSAPGSHSNIITTDLDEYTRRVIDFFDAVRQRQTTPANSEG